MFLNEAFSVWVDEIENYNIINLPHCLRPNAIEYAFMQFAKQIM